jgi:hypothetical protein
LEEGARPARSRPRGARGEGGAVRRGLAAGGRRGKKKRKEEKKRRKEKREKGRKEKKRINRKGKEIEKWEKKLERVLEKLGEFLRNLEEGFLWVFRFFGRRCDFRDDGDSEADRSAGPWHARDSRRGGRPRRWGGTRVKDQMATREGGVNRSR